MNLFSLHTIVFLSSLRGKVSLPRICIPVIVSFLFLMFSLSISAQENSMHCEPNPDSEEWCKSLLFKSHAEVIEILYPYYMKTWKEKTEAFIKIVEFARKYKDKRLELTVEFLYNEMKQFNPYIGIELHRALLEKVQKIGYKEIQIACLRTIMNLYMEIDEFGNSFETSKLLEKLLHEVSDEDYTEKPFVYLAMFNLHYAFRDYRTALVFAQNAAQLPVKKERYYHPHATALCSMGICYNELNLLDSAEICFLRIINETQFSHYHYWKIWTVIAGKDLGEIYVKRGQYDKAIPLFEEAIDYMPRHDDENFAVGAAISLADIYILQKDIQKAKALVESPRLKRSNLLPTRLESWYKLLADYYALTKDYSRAFAYKDSVIMSQKENVEKFNAMRLLRIEQRENALEMQLKNEQIAYEQKHKKDLKMWIIVLTIAIFTTIILLYVVYAMYRKKQRAYRDLVLKNQQWAGLIPIEEMDTDDEQTTPVQQDVPLLFESVPNSMDKLIMGEIQKLIEEGIYKNHELTLDLLAKKVNQNSTYVSSAINRCTGKNFKTYINEYRIKDAIRILSDNSQMVVLVDELAFEVGFNDRKNFYRVFKKITGLSPSDFKKKRPVR